MEGLEIYKTLILSTGHLNPKDLDLIDPDWGESKQIPYNPNVTPDESVIPTLVERTTSGWRLYIYQDCEGWEGDMEDLKGQGLSEGLISLIRLAHQEDCRFVEFHWDGPTLNDYPIFNW